MCYGEKGTVKFFETLADNVLKHNYSMMQIKKKMEWWENFRVTQVYHLKTLSKRSYVKDLKQFISGLTFARGSNQPFISNAIVFLSSSRADMFRLFNFEKTVEGIPLLILIYHMDNILTLHLFLLQRGTYFRYDFRGRWYQVFLS